MKLLKIKNPKTIPFLFILLSMLILVQTAYAGVTNPLPTELNLLKGESGRFKFQIQTVASNQEIECNYYFDEESLLLVEFDPANIIVPAGTIKEVYGTVTAPEELDFGIYEENFCISCKPTAGQAGTAVEIETCDLPIKVNVVEERAKENMAIPPAPFEIPYGKIIIVLIVLAVIILIHYLLKRKHLVLRTKKPVKRL